jgi:PIN domain nuclease of toxin-antitoxin system
LTLYLADAVALIDFYTGDPAFPKHLIRLFEETPGTIAVAATTVWEIAIKTRLGKLPAIHAPGFPTLAAMLRHHGFEPLIFDDHTAEEAANLPSIHADPFDRALIAAARRTGRTILTRDQIIAGYGVPVVW